ncbi:hypothetical protein [Sphingobacterium sp. LRF_L2]|uniref:hypothetical protein n=1 Tax=Sphingobacterium sp. LRF_L2 TaxID=3369421 RepID=UPI003F5E0F1E
MGLLSTNGPGALENYHFEDSDGGTLLRIEVDTNEDHITFFETAWPKTLRKLKELAEKES